MIRILDLNEEERRECLEEYVSEYKNSRKGAADRLHLEIRLRSIGMDQYEIRDVITSL